MRKVAKNWMPSCMGMMCVFGSSCASTSEDSSRLNCATFNETFFSKPTTVQMTEFNSFDLEDQYAIFICGNQTREPPSIHLATPFAREGPAIVSFLKTKLIAARGDLTIRDIVLVFAEMSRLKSYDVAGDGDLMRALAEAVNKVKDADWRRVCEQSLSDIRQQNSAQLR